MTTSESTFAVKPPASVSAARPLEASAVINVGLRSAPYLADHGFQDMVVLPGSFYIDLALQMEREHLNRAPCFVRNAAFHNPIILSTEDVLLQVEAKNLGHGCSEYAVYESGENTVGRTSLRQLAAKLEIARISPASPDPNTFAMERFQADAKSVTSSEQFYRKLRSNGNQYGPHFQNVSTIWRADDQILGKLSVPRPNGSHVLHPSLLDSVTQLLASFILEGGRTFVLRAIERIAINSTDFPDTLWGHATLRKQDRDGLIGDVQVFDQSGKPYLELSGVAFSLLDRVDAADEKTPANLVIAANFTAEPLEDSLNFWGDHFGVPIRTEFAPYNQVIQQLLDTNSAFHKNREGVNVILLGLEEWTSSERSAHSLLDKEKAAQCFGNRARYVLPNGLEIVHLNQYETDYVYQEIFEDQCYLRHGIRLQDGDTVVDIGANIGLFSLFVMNRCKDPKIFAFEPAPVVFDLLQANFRAHGSNVRAVNAGVSDKARTATFTFYEKSSVFSSFHADETEDRAAIQAVVRNMLNGEAATDESVDEYVSELTADRLRRQTVECRLVSVSDIIRENQIETINLLKIDAEKSELDVLNGIAEADWPKISQIVMEIHDRTGETVKRIEALLSAKRFRCAVEHEKLLEHSGLFNLYAVRDATTPSPLNGARAGLQKTVGDFCTALRSFADQTTTPLVLCICPKSPNSGADLELNAALNEAEQTLLNEADAIPNVHAISSALLMQRYPVKDYYDPHGHDLGHIPYTPECFTWDPLESTCRHASLSIL